MTEIEALQIEKVYPLDIPEQMTIQEAEEMLVRVVNYSDYLAEARKAQRLLAKDLKKVYEHWKWVYLKDANKNKVTIGDATAREAYAEDLASAFFDEFDTADIEADYIKNLMFTNHDKVEALRTIISSKKTVWEKTMKT